MCEWIAKGELLLASRTPGLGDMMKLEWRMGRQVTRELKVGAVRLVRERGASVLDAICDATV